MLWKPDVLGHPWMEYDLRVILASETSGRAPIEKSCLIHPGAYKLQPQTSYLPVSVLRICCSSRRCC